MHLLAAFEGAFELEQPSSHCYDAFGLRRMQPLTWETATEFSCSTHRTQRRHISAQGQHKPTGLVSRSKGPAQHL